MLYLSEKNVFTLMSNVNTVVRLYLDSHMPCVAAFLLEVRVHLLVFFAHSFCFWPVAQKNRTVNYPIPTVIFGALKNQF